MIDPKHFDLLRIAGLHHKPKSEEEKRYPTFNTRMMAITIDFLILSLSLKLIVDYLFVQLHGQPPIDINKLIQQLSFHSLASEAIRDFFRISEESGFSEYWRIQMTWHFYSMCAYFMICWHFWSASPGKILFRLSIVDAKTLKPISDLQSFFRAFGFVLSILPPGLGVFWMAFDKKKRGFHDYFAGTVVIKKSELKRLREEELARVTSATEAAHLTDSLAPSKVE